MKIWKNKFLKQMIIVITVIFLIMNCVAPNYVYANKSTEGDSWSLTGIINAINTVLGGVAGGLIGFALGGPVGAFVGIGAGVTVNYIVVTGLTDGWDEVPGNIFDEFIQFVVTIGDVIMDALQSLMFNGVGFWGNTMISNTDDNLGVGASGKEDSGSWLYANEADVETLESGKPSERGSTLVGVERETIERRNLVYRGNEKNL